MFHGATLERVGLGEFILQLQFGGPRRPEIAIEGDWELRSSDGRIIDRQLEPAARDAYRIHLLLGRSVEGSELRAPESFVLRFDSGPVLEVFDRSRDYESFSIQPGDVVV